MNSKNIPTRRIVRKMTAEDPTRVPHEKETGIHLLGDADRFSITSLKKPVFSKLLLHPDFEAAGLNVIDDSGYNGTVNSINEVAADSTLTIIGVSGSLPVGALSIGATRKSNSHARIVK